VGDEWTNPVTRFAIRVEESAVSTGGARVRWLATYPPCTPPPPAHFHPQQTERFVIVSGRVRVRVGESERDLPPGTELEIAPRQVHQMWNPFAEPAAVRWETTPALRAERWMGLLIEFAQLGRTNARGVPPLPQLALLLRAHRDEFRLARPSPLVQAIVFGLAAAIGRLRGASGERVR
jgi:mannose-6-phosphate isomerase-like protein (cupin superfamily)